MLLLVCLFPGCVASQPTKFSLRSIVPGNWSSSSNGEFRVLYFVPLFGLGHYQALLNDKFLDIFIRSPTSAGVTYAGYNFSFEIDNPMDTHPTAFAKVSDALWLDICLVSGSAVEVSIADVTNKRILSWAFTRPGLRRITLFDQVKAVGLLVGVVFFAKKTIGYCFPSRLAGQIDR
jgi:hypothetical protein